MKFVLILLLTILVACKPPKPDEKSKTAAEQSVSGVSIPLVNHDCSLEATEGVSYQCQFNISNIKNGVSYTWYLHGFNTCQWASIDSTTGLVSGIVTNGSDCKLVLLVEDSLGRENSVVLKLTVDNAINDEPVVAGACSSSVNEGASYSCTFAAYDEDDYTFTYALDATNTCSWASFADASSPTVTGTPSIGASTCTLAFRAYDDELAQSNLISTSITVAENSNDAPVISASCSGSASEGSAYICNFSSSDEESDATTYSLDASNTCSWASIATPTLAQVTGVPSVSGTCVLAFVANDGTVDSTIYSKTITVADTFNDAPTITQTCSTAPNENDDYDCTFTGFDEEGATLSYALNTGTTCDWATIEDSSTPTITGQPTVGGETCDILFYASDGVNTSTVETVSITVAETYNDSPRIYQHCPISADEDAAWSCTFTVSDEEGDTLTYDMAPGNTCAWASFNDPNIETITQTATAGGKCTLAVRAHDGSRYSPDLSFQVTINDITNDVPVITESCATAINENETYSCIFSAVDEEGVTLSYQLHSSNTCDWASISSSSVPHISGTPNIGGTSCNLVFYATDGVGNSVNSTVVVNTAETYDDPPVLGLTCDSNALEGVLYTCNFTAYDEEGADLTFTETIGSPNCDNWTALAFTKTGTNTGYFQGQPEDGSTICDLSLKANDGTNDSTLVSFNVNVAETANDLPTITTLFCNTTMKVGEYFQCRLLVDDDDLGDTLTFHEDAANTCTWASVANENSSLVTGFPDSVGSCDLVFYVTDKSGTPVYYPTTTVSPGTPITITISANQEIGFSQIASGDNFTCGVTAAGVASCWGSNTVGQIGNGNNFSSKFPRDVDMSAYASDNKFTQITAGNYHACGITASGTAYCWGYNNVGQLGDATSTNSNTPVVVDVSSLSSNYANFHQIVAGKNFTCALNSLSNAYCWGSNTQGKLGNNDIVTSSSTVPIKVYIPTAYTTDQFFKQISVGENNACGLTAAGNVYCWGDNQYRQLGTATSASYSAAMVKINVSGTETAFTKISVGYGHICGVVASGNVYCWGKGTSGQLGNGASNNNPTPVKVDFSEFSSFAYLGHIEEIEAGDGFSCAMDSLGLTACWGSNQSGQIGNGSTTSSYTTPQYTTYYGDLADYTLKKISAGKDHICGINVKGNGYCWGSGATGQLGHYLLSGSRIPVMMYMNDIGDEATLHFETLSEGLSDHVCGRTSNGKHYCWGKNNFGQLGLGTSSGTPTYAPAEVTVGGVDYFNQISVGYNHSCALNDNGRAYCWGENTNGEFGDGNAGVNSLAAVAVDFSTNPEDYFYRQISAGTNFTNALSGTGQGYAWGDSTNGVIGYSPLIEQGDAGASWDETIAQITSHYPSSPNLRYFQQLSAGSDHACAITSNGTIYCWGNNANSEVGLSSTTTSYSTPVPSNAVSSSSLGKKYKQISLGYQHTCALNSIGEAYCWGLGTSGQLGNSTWLESDTPQYVQMSLFAASEDYLLTQISSGAYHSCGITGDGKAYCWGLNTFGQLGDTTTTSSNIPVAVNTTLRFKEIRAYHSSTCALTDDGSAYCWGKNTLGALGINNAGVTELHAPDLAQPVLSTIP